MKKTMKAAVIVAPEKVEIRELPVPEPGRGEILVRQHACAICTMEQRVFKGILKLPYPGCWGHEVSGVVEKVGEGCETSLKPGDHVVLGAGMFCGQCYYCATGHDVACTQRHALPQVAGITGIFGMAEYAVVRSDRAVKVADDLPFEEAAFAEPVSCVVQSANKLNIQLGETVVVIGAGTMGLLNLMVSQLRGAKVIVSEIDPARRQKALELGAHAVIDPTAGPAGEQVRQLNDGRGADVVIVAIGNGKANEDALKMVGPQGRVMLFASAHPATPLTIDPNFIHHSGIWITGSSGKNYKDLWQAALLLSARLVKPRPLIEDIYPLDRAEEALRRASSGGTYRLVLTM
ncbi:MAG: zinc-binding dehydrogenase [Firmicutes bacterium]|nr:zinc-binding dehydrogenase [Candidatus Fermentithermobacillaceae bacterium]